MEHWASPGVTHATFPRVGVATRARMANVQRLTKIETIRGRVPLPLVRRSLHEHVFAPSRLPRR